MTRELSQGTVNHYDVLGLPSPTRGQRVSAATIKSAYRRALLHHHPDKRPSSNKPKTADRSQKTSSGLYTIDQITAAYNILSSAKARADLDRSLLLRPTSGTALDRRGQDADHHPGLETVDLDDLQYDEEKQTWYRACRCGDDRGFTITEHELDQAADQGEILAGCRGCSLWLNVVFQVLDEEDTVATEAGGFS
ncbi:MAG: hypothetical protein M1817_003588 [Caeruleum heppii]|nr:MAG: hypothetical protein M1817_003588 [Caeruleum heppii]